VSAPILLTHVLTIPYCLTFHPALLRRIVPRRIRLCIRSTGTCVCVEAPIVGSRIGLQPLSTWNDMKKVNARAELAAQGYHATILQLCTSHVPYHFGVCCRQPARPADGSGGWCWLPTILDVERHERVGLKAAQVYRVSTTLQVLYVPLMLLFLFSEPPPVTRRSRPPQYSKEQGKQQQNNAEKSRASGAISHTCPFTPTNVMRRLPAHRVHPPKSRCSERTAE
jgi:hypothetical protein